MIDNRLFQLTEKKNLIQLVVVKLMQLISSIVMWVVIANQLTLYVEIKKIDGTFLIGMLFLVSIVKIGLNLWIEKLTYYASSGLRLSMREAVMKKAFRLGQSQEQLPPSVLAQLSVDGIEQLETYYARFLPQLFYCLVASLLIFATLVTYAWLPALVLLVCMPLIPLIIMSVMKIAKRILSKYWTQYTDLGARFHENLSGLSTLKAYNQDENKQIEAAADAERFRKATMSLLSMQLNSITVMDIVSYSGAGLGIGLALITFTNHQISLTGMLLFILLSAEFFIPMRQLGSLFHVAMNGISACKRLFSYLELPEPTYGTEVMNEKLTTIQVGKVTYEYEKSNQSVLKDITLTLNEGTFTALVGKSGSGKSTIAKLIVHQLSSYKGTILWNHQELKELTKETIQETVILVDNHGFLYPLTIKENLLVGNTEASDEQLWQVLEQVQLAEFVTNLPNQLETVLSENGQNLSGGQRQRLLLARALLKNAECYVFDEITSGIDLKSEEIIVACLLWLAKTHIVLFISHRLYNVVHADQVAIVNSGELVDVGTPEELKQRSTYFKNYFKQEQLLIDGGES